MPIRLVRLHLRLLLSVAIGVAVFFAALLADWRTPTRVLAGWDVGVGYTIGAWDFGLAYMRGEVGNENGNGDNTLDVATLGATYTVGDGLSVYAEGVWFQTDSAVNSTSSFDNDGLALITGIGVSF